MQPRIILAIACCQIALSVPSWAQTHYSLKQALQSARQHNPVLKSQVLDMEASKADVVTAGLRPNPTLNNQSLQLAGSSYFAPGTEWHNNHNRQVWWQLTKPVQWPGQRDLKIETAQQQALVSSKEYIETERNLFSTVALKWLDAWTTYKKLDIMLLAKSNIDSLAAVNEYSFKREATTQTDLLRTRVLNKQFQLQIQTTRQTLTNEIKNLKFLIGTTDSIAIDTTDAFLYSVPLELDSLLALAMNKRSDVEVARQAIQFTETNIKLQKRLAYPVPELGVIWNPQNTVPYIGFFGTIDLPFFSRNQGEIQKAYILKRQQEQNYSTLQVLTQTEVQNAFRAYLTEQQNLQEFTSILDESQTILTNVQYAYLRGSTTIVDYLEAQRSWLEVRQQYFDTLQTYRQSFIQVLFTTGLINQLAQ